MLPPESATCGNNKNHSAGDKFLTVIESYRMNESELSQYCRAKGLYIEEVKKLQDILNKLEL
jgi:transposase